MRIRLIRNVSASCSIDVSLECCLEHLAYDRNEDIPLPHHVAGAERSEAKLAISWDFPPKISGNLRFGISETQTFAAEPERRWLRGKAAAPCRIGGKGAERFGAGMQTVNLTRLMRKLAELSCRLRQDAPRKRAGPS